MDADLEIPCRGPLPGLFCGVRWMEAGRKAHMVRGDRATGNFLRSHTILWARRRACAKTPMSAYTPILTDIF